VSEPLELVNVRLAVRGNGARLDFAAVHAAAESGTESRRGASFARGAGAIDTPVRPRTSVDGSTATGPLILQSYDTTIVVPPGARAHADAFGNLIVEL